ncbi:hypothetical protein ACWDSL_47555 [Streptomyces sp. NPDC000941]
MPTAAPPCSARRRPTRKAVAGWPPTRVPEKPTPFFYYEGSGPGPLKHVLYGLAADPESFAVLYDAERAYLAYYLERLGGDGVNPSVRGMDLGSTELELVYVGAFAAELMSARAEAIEEGDIPDSDAFDRSVHHHSNGTYRTAAHRMTGHPAQETIARRKAIPAREDGFLDGSEQLLLIYNRWVRERGIKAVPAALLRSKMEEACRLRLRLNS